MADLEEFQQKQREKDPRTALSDLLKAVKPNISQFLFVTVLVIMCGATLAISKVTQAFMTWEDKNNNGQQDWATEKGEFLVTGALQSTQFLLVYGISKSISNFIVGVASDKYGKRPVLLFGWVLGSIIPIMVMASSSWDVVVLSNLFLGLQQGLCWSITIFIFIDYCGPKNRGVAVGLNESVGYTSVAIFNVITAAIVNEDSRDNINYRREPYVIVLVFCIVGFFGSLFYLKDTKWLVDAETKMIDAETKNRSLTNIQIDAETNSPNKTSDQKKDETINIPKVKITWPSGREKEVSVIRMAFIEVTFLNQNLMLCAQVGLMINFLTAFVWGILTKWVKSYGNTPNWEAFDGHDVADILLAYGLTKGVLQFLTGYLSDRCGRKIIIVAGMWIADAGLIICYIVGNYAQGQSAAKSGFIFSAFLIGLGTALMYPNAIAAAAENADPSWRASAVGTYRFWRDSGYWIGGLILGAVTDSSSILSAVLIGAFLAFFSGLLFLIGYKENPEKQLDISELKWDDKRKSTVVEKVINTAVAPKGLDSEGTIEEKNDG